MKLLQRTRLLFQLLTFLSMMLVLGSLGAWETGAIGFTQMALQLLAFSALGLFCALLSSRRPARRRQAARAYRPRPVHAGRAPAAHAL